MSETTGIEWTDSTWTPIRARVKKDAAMIAKAKGYTSLIQIGEKMAGRVGPHCERVSPGCEHCYSEMNNGRCLPHNGTGLPFDRRARELVDIFLDEKILTKPLHWKRPRTVFVCSQTDLFGEWVPDEVIDRVFDVIWEASNHTFQILTKRVERMVDYVERRASARSFGWTEREREPIHPGYIAHMDDIFYRNQCGYAHGDWQCSHPSNESKECHTYECPIASTVDDRETLTEIGVADQYEYDSEGYAEDSEWMKFYGRPSNALPGNIQFGFSAENQDVFTKRMRAIRPLRWIVGPYNIIWASLEPLVGPINTTIPFHDEPGAGPWSAFEKYDFSDGGGELHVPYLNWVVVGGESGAGARPMEIEWARSLRDQCKAANVPFFMKQLGGVRDSRGELSDFPEDMRVREYPA